ncbi:MAG TPA: alanine racemase [Magnetospirillaceae bacterium]|nr:alanine racemase [Magnetospirillaceae bacterium]
MDSYLSGCAYPMVAAATLTIDLGALRANYRAVRAAAAPAVTGAVVKADAYGLGADRVVPALYQEGCRNFFVAQLGEALALRPILPADARLFVMNGLQPGTERACLEAGITPMLNSLEQVAKWSALGVAAAARLPAVLQFDSGMSRLGLPPMEARRLAAEPALLAGIEPLYAMSHLASADDLAEPQNQEQLAAMREVRALFPALPLCLANSAGIFLGPDFHGALVRPGIALYGGVPNPAAAQVIQPVVRLDVPVIQTRIVPAGTRIGYGGDFVAPSEMRLAAIEAGYADGLPRHLGGFGAAFHEGVRLPMVGRVSMDSTVIDISALPPGTLHLGSKVELIGPHQSLDQLAVLADTIAYEILTRLGRRYQRVYKD